MNKKKYNFFIDESLITTISDLYGGKQTHAAERAIDIWLSMRRIGMNTLYGLFTKAELSMFVDMLNGSVIEGKLMPHKATLLLHLQDAVEFDSMHEKWGIDLDETVSKIEKLNPTEVTSLLDEIYRFWHVSSAYGSPRPSLEDFMVNMGAVK